MRNKKEEGRKDTHYIRHTKKCVMTHNTYTIWTEYSILHTIYETRNTKEGTRNTKADIRNKNEELLNKKE